MSGYPWTRLVVADSLGVLWPLAGIELSLRSRACAAAPAANAAAGACMTEYTRPFGPKTPWNVPVAGPPRHLESDRYARLLWEDALASRPGNFSLTFVEYTYPVYYAQDPTSEYSVKVSAKWGNLDGARVPWNPQWQPTPDTDAQVILLDPKTGREHSVVMGSIISPQE